MKRRTVLGVVASSGVLPVLGQHRHGEAPAAAEAHYKPKVLTQEELALTAQLADHVIPRTDTPGASDAGVHLFIDSLLHRRRDNLRTFRAGLRRFRGLSPDKQVELLTRSSSSKDRFFALLKELTIDGYYSSRAGLAQELGWKGLTPLPEFKGCTHPEHQS